MDGKQIEVSSGERVAEEIADQDKIELPRLKPESKSLPSESMRKRQPIFGKHAAEVPTQPLHELIDDGSESDSGDDFEDDFVEDDIKQAEEEMAKANEEGNNPLEPRDEPDVVFLTPFIESSIDQKVVDYICAAPEACIPVEIPKELTLDSRSSEALAVAPKPKSKGRSRPTTPLVESGATSSSKINVQNAIPNLEAQVSTQLRDIAVETQATPFIEPQASPDHAEADSSLTDLKIEPETTGKMAVNGKTRKSAPMDTFDDRDEELIQPTAHDILAVRKLMATPPLSTLPRFNCKKWDEDEEFLKTLDADPAVETYILSKMVEAHTRREREKEHEREQWSKRYYEYRKWTDFSQDPVPVRSREKFAKSREKRAAEQQHFCLQLLFLARSLNRSGGLEVDSLQNTILRGCFASLNKKPEKQRSEKSALQGPEQLTRRKLQSLICVGTRKND